MAADEEKCSPYELHEAAKVGNETIVSELLMRSDVADLVRKRDSHERTALHLACFKNHGNIVTQLLAAGASVNATAKAGFSALHFAAQAGATMACEALLIGGAKPSVWEARKKHTPLHLAAMKGHADVVSLLLRYGADPVAKTKRGETPFDLGSKHESILAVLSSHLDEHLAQDQPIITTLNEKSHSNNDVETPKATTNDMNHFEKAAELGRESEQDGDKDANQDEAQKLPIQSPLPLDINEDMQQPVKKKQKKTKKGFALSLSHLESGDVPF